MTICVREQEARRQLRVLGMQPSAHSPGKSAATYGDITDKLVVQLGWHRDLYASSICSFLQTL